MTACIRSDSRKVWTPEQRRKALELSAQQLKTKYNLTNEDLVFNENHVFFTPEGYKKVTAIERAAADAKWRSSRPNQVLSDSDIWRLEAMQNIAENRGYY